MICGTETGELIETDLRNTSRPIRTLITSSEITSLQMTGNKKCITATGKVVPRCSPLVSEVVEISSLN